MYLKLQIFLKWAPYCVGLLILVLPHSQAFAFGEESEGVRYFWSDYADYARGKAASPGSCEAQSDQFCRDLWSKENLGNYKLGDNQFFLGPTEVSRIRIREKEHLLSFYRALKDLPSDLRKRIEKPAEKLNRLLSNESKDMQWKQHLGRAKVELSQAIRNTAIYRVGKTKPYILKQKSKKWLPSEKISVKLVKDSLLDQALELRFRDHKNWVQIQNIFKSFVKPSAIESVQKLHFGDPQLNRKMIGLLNSVELSLPYQSVDKGGLSEGCASVEANAYYSTFHHKIFVCAGYIEGVWSRADIISLLGHEIAHSIGPLKMIDIAYDKSAMARLANQLFTSKATLPCKTWDDLKELAVAPTAFQLNSLWQRHLMCINPKSQEETFDVDKLALPARMSSQQLVTFFTNNEFFTLLTSPRISKSGTDANNDFFLRPDLFEASLNNNQLPVSPDGNLYLSYLFVQEYRCEVQRRKDQKDIEDLRAKSLEQAVQSSKSLMEDYFRINWLFAKNESASLIDFGLARPSEEVWADWFTLQSGVSKYIESIESSEKVLEETLSMGTIYCDKSGLDSLAPDLKKAEAQTRTRVHSQNRDRRLSFFSPSVVEKVKCEANGRILEFYQCTMGSNRKFLDALKNK